MVNNLMNLSKYGQIDIEKSKLVNEILDKHIQESLKESYQSRISYSKMNYDKSCDYSLEAPELEDDEVCFISNAYLDESKYCPECGRKYPKSENVCFDCLVHLKNVSDEVDIFDIESDSKFTFEGDMSFDNFNDLLSEENRSKINEFNFSLKDFEIILHNIKSQAFKNFDNLIKENDIDFDSLEILDKIILFAKSFVKVEYKSYGSQLGYFEDGTIYVDDRQIKSLQITTLIHELSHFLLNEMLDEIICRILNCTKNSLTENLTRFILSYSMFAQLVDEYSAHSVEGRFTLFGYQDYSSFNQIKGNLKGEMSEEEIEITKSIGNTFAISIKKVLESIIDRDLRKEIKDQFLEDVLDSPDYNALIMENCQMLNDEGFMRAIWLILNEGFEVAALNIDKLLELKN